MFEYLFVLVNHDDKVLKVNGQGTGVFRSVSAYDFANEKGREGWELAGVVGPHDHDQYKLIFRRYIQ